MVKALNQCETLAGTLADIRHFIEIDADKALDDYNNNRTDGISNNAYRFAKALTTFHFENLNYISKGKGFDFMFKNLWRCYDKNKQKAMACEDDLEQKYSFFVDDASSSSEKTIITDEKKLKEKFQNLLIKFTTELEKAYNNLNVEQVVVDKLLPYEDQVTKKYNLAQGQTERALTIISDFNTYLSFDSTKLDIGRFDEKYNFVKKTVAPKEEPKTQKKVVHPAKVEDDEEDFDPVVTYRPAPPPWAGATWTSTPSWPPAPMRSPGICWWSRMTASRKTPSTACARVTSSSAAEDWNKGVISWRESDLASSVSAATAPDM